MSERVCFTLLEWFLNHYSWPLKFHWGWVFPIGHLAGLKIEKNSKFEGLEPKYHLVGFQLLVFWGCRHFLWFKHQLNGLCCFFCFQQVLCSDPALIHMYTLNYILYFIYSIPHRPISRRSTILLTQILRAPNLYRSMFDESNKYSSLKLTANATPENGWLEEAAERWSKSWA